MNRPQVPHGPDHALDTTDQSTETVPKTVANESSDERKHHVDEPSEADQFEILARKLWRYLERVEIIGAVDADTRNQLGQISSSSQHGADADAEGALFTHDGKNDRDIVAALVSQDIHEMDNANMTLEEILASSRWDRCGFMHDNNSHNPLDDFSHGGGLLAAKCLLYFLIRYPRKHFSLLINDYCYCRYEDRAAFQLSKTVCERRKFCSVPNVRD